MNTTSLPFVLNRSGEFKVPEDGWFHLAPFGEIRAPMAIPGQEEEVEIVQVINRDVVDAIVERFNAEASAPNFPGVLVDYDHFSSDEDKPSRAAGWIEKVEARETGLWGQVRFSAGGKAALEGGEYRLFSPTLGFIPKKYAKGERVFPAALLRGALTNDPRFKGMVPLSNRQGSLATTRNAQSAATMDYKSELLKLLGLAATATDADVTAALSARNTEAENRKTELAAAQNRAAKLEADLIEHDLDKAGLSGDARTAAKTLLTKNRDDGIAFLATLSKPESGYQPIHNRSTARTPAAGSGRVAADAKDSQRTAAVQAYQTANRCSFDEAWNAVRAEKPALFTES